MKIRRGVLYILLIAGIIALFLPGFTKLQQLKDENDNLEKEILNLKVSNEELKNLIHKMETDPVFIESVARDKLKKSKKGEIVYKTK